MKSEALRKAMKKAVKETSYILKGNQFPKFESRALKMALEKAVKEIKWIGTEK